MQCILLLFMWTNLSCQAKKHSLADACTQLAVSMYQDEFNYERISSYLEEYRNLMQESSQAQYEACNCADSLWLKRNTHRYTYLKKTHSTDLDTIQFLNGMSHAIDGMNLQAELRFQKLDSQVDSFAYVIKRLKVKHGKKKYIYGLISAEMDYLKEHKFELREQYLRLIDNIQSDPTIVDNVLVAFFNSDDAISNEMKKRIGKAKFERYFYRMYGIINTSSSSKFPINQIEILENIDYKIEEEKLDYILQSFYTPNWLKEIESKDLERLKRILDDPKFKVLESIQKLKDTLEKSRDY